MRFLRWRVRTRTTLILVAVAALLLAGLDGWKRSSDYQRRAEYHSRKLRVVESMSAALEDLEAQGRADSMWFAHVWGNPDRFFSGVVSPSETLKIGLAADDFRAELQWLRSYHGALERKYRFASRLPWASIAPDPPPRLSSFETSRSASERR